MLTERQLQIVISVVNEYIRYGDSVGSRTISKRYLTDHSSATIRNEMSDLEDMGYLKHTHTSSGRIPTTRGFRLYVDSILRRLDARSIGKDWFSTLRDQRRGLEGAVEAATDMLSRVSNYVGVAAISPLNSVKFQRVDFVRGGERNVLMLVVLQGGLVHHKMISVPTDMSQEYLDDLARRINFFSGRNWTELKKALREYILQELSEYRAACSSALTALEEIVITPTVKVFTGSMSHIFDLPDFQDLGRIQTLFSFLEQEESISELLQNYSMDGGINVVIGEENESPALKKSSLVATSDVTNGQRAMIGIIGPERMDYERSIMALNEVLQSIEPESEEE